MKIDVTIFPMPSPGQRIITLLALIIAGTAYPPGIHAKEPTASQPRAALVIDVSDVNQAEVAQALQAYLANSACAKAIKAGAQPIGMHVHGLNAKGEKISQFTSSVPECAMPATYPSHSVDSPSSEIALPGTQP